VQESAVETEPEPTEEPQPSETPQPTEEPVETTAEDAAAAYHETMAAGIGTVEYEQLTQSLAVSFVRGKTPEQKEEGVYCTDYLPEEWVATSPEEVRFVIHCRHDAEMVGQYTGMLYPPNGAPYMTTVGAYQRYVWVQIEDLRTGEILAKEKFVGGEPEKTISDLGDNYGSYPDEAAITAWFLPYLEKEVDTARKLALEEAEESIGKGNSREGVLENVMLFSDGDYCYGDAVYAVDNCRVDWNEEAWLLLSETVASYTYNEAGARSLLEDTYHFTSEQASYAIALVDWNLEAVEAAEEIASLPGWAPQWIINYLCDGEPDGGYGYTLEQATYAVENADIDWNEQALHCLLNDISSGYAASASIWEAILEYDYGFAHEQAVYAVENCGIDWFEHAALFAQKVLKKYPDDYTTAESLAQYMEGEAGFTAEQTQHAVSVVFPE